MPKFVYDGLEYSSNGHVVKLTQAEYDALPNTKLADDIIYLIIDSNDDRFEAKNIPYNGSITGLGNTVQDAIDNLKNTGIELDYSKCNPYVKDLKTFLQKTLDLLWPAELKVFPGNHTFSFYSHNSPGTVVANKDSMYRSNCPGSYCEIMFYDAIAIDVSGYSKVTAKIKTSSYSGSSAGGPALRIFREKPTSWGHTALKVAGTINSTGTFEQTIDLSDVTGTIYVGVLATYWNFEILEIKFIP